MRWTEIVEYATAKGLALPTYRQMDIWTRDGKLRAEFRGDRTGRFRWWDPAEVEAALTVARLMSTGMDDDLAFSVARTTPDKFGARKVILDGGEKPHITITVDAV